MMELIVKVVMVMTIVTVRRHRRISRASSDLRPVDARLDMLVSGKLARMCARGGHVHDRSPGGVSPCVAAAARESGGIPDTRPRASFPLRAHLQSLT